MRRVFRKVQGRIKDCFVVVVVVDSLLITTPIVGFCNCSMFCCALLCVHSSLTIISMGKKELVVLLCSWCLVIVVWLLLTMTRGCLQFVIVVFSDHTPLTIFLEGGFICINVCVCVCGGGRFADFIISHENEIIWSR